MAKGGDRPAIRMDSVFDVAEVTPDAANDLPDGICRKFLVGTAGTLRVTTAGGTVINFASGELAAGVWHDMQVRRVHDTGTTATGIKAGY